jgi:putative transposase
MIETIRRTSRNVKRWQSGEMALRWMAAGMLEAERQFRKIIGYQHRAKLALAIERDLTRHHVPNPTTEEGATLVIA